jgi:hypothetical protein
MELQIFLTKNKFLEREILTRNNLPVVENGHTECLTLGVSPEIGLETEGVDSRNERLDGVQGRSGYRGILKKN